MGKKHKQKSNPHQKNIFSYFHHSTSENATTHIILTPTTYGLPISHIHTPFPKFKQEKTTKECTTENRHPTKEKKNTTTCTNLIMPSRRKANQNPMP
jgi:hypothetical protein